MVALHHDYHYPTLARARARRSLPRVNWRLLLAVGGAALFWVAIGATGFHLLH